MNYYPNNISILENRTFVVENIPCDITRFELREGFEYYLIGSEFEWDTIIDIYIPFSLKTQTFLRKAYVTVKTSKAAEYIVNNLNDHIFSDGVRLNARLLTWKQKY
jgi:RNA recognition motif-containing protein